MYGDESTSLHSETAQDPVVTSEVRDGESVAEAIVTAVSSASDADESDLRPLYDAIDPDALDALFRPVRSDTSRQREGRVVFEYGDRKVCVESGGTVRVY
ncbi:hypothetical protein M0R88_16110 [Halorussus gelatinilyticus]|uniref:Halobacterial output domain-containing protein n=1 Tax=Halorussus gelatinilyticus TaxID=2937524 RepID=A0A8U0IH53_9EURY|nr:HalOD1 output domain-containing protein [Halorussus gelatinilyticus]UPW00026.1 hypothetical protein M0R88_16110 [Halorussus gelatinilyticus]